MHSHTIKLLEKDLEVPFYINTVHDLSMIILFTDRLYVTGYTLYW